MSIFATRIARFCLSMVFAAVVACSFGPIARAQVVAVFHPTADSYVDSAYPKTNFGLEPFLDVSGGALPGSVFRHTFLKFDLSGYIGQIASARLVLYGQHVGASAAAGGSEPDTAWGVPDNAWTELGITWNNQPALGPALSTVTVTSTPAYYSWDVTSFVKTRVAGTTGRVITLAVTEALVPGGSQSYDVFGSTPRPVASPVMQRPEPQLLVSP